MSLGILNIGASDNDPAADSIRAGGRKLNVAPAVISRTVTAPPGSPAIGAIYIVPSGATGAWSGQTNKVAYYNGTTWEFYTPAEGWRTWVTAEAVMIVFTAGAWNDSAIGGGGGVGEAPNDGGYYARRNEAWEAFTPGAGGGGEGYSETIVFQQNFATTSASSVNFPLSAEYDYFRVEFTGIAGGAPYLAFSTDNGATYLTATGDYTRGFMSENNDGILTGTAALGLFFGGIGGNSFAVIRGHKYSTHLTTLENYTMVSASLVQSEYSFATALAIHNRARIQAQTGSFTGGILRVIGVKAGSGGSGDPVPFAGFRVRKNAQQTPTAGVVTEVTWQTEDFDTENAFASNRFTVPAELDGKYGSFFVGLNFTTAPTGAAALYIQRSSDGGTVWNTFCQVEFSNEARTIGLTGPVLLTAGHIWRLSFFLNPTATLNNVDSTFFSMAVLDPGVVAGGGGATPLDLKTVSGAYTLLDTDLAGNVYITADTSAGACTITVPDTLTGTEPVAIERSGANDCTLVAGGTTTIRSADGHLKLRVDASVATLVPKGADVYTLSGDLSA